MRLFSSSVLGLALTAVGLSASAQQPYPTRPITVVVPFAAGGPTDVMTRILGQHVSQTLGQQIVIENVTGGGGSIGAARVAKAAPDRLRRRSSEETHLRQRRHRFDLPPHLPALHPSHQHADRACAVSRQLAVDE